MRAPSATPTREQLQAAFEALRAANPPAWSWSLDETLAHPIRGRIVTARALQQLHEEARRRSRRQIPVPYQLPDGRWRTAMVYGERTDQLAIPEDRSQ